MDIDETAGPYRGFLRSGTYPALSKRIVNSGSLLLRAASWFALIVTAASAGFSMTQRLVSESAAGPQAASVASAPSKQPAQLASTASDNAPQLPIEPAAATPGLAAARASSPPNAKRESASIVPLRTAGSVLENKAGKRKPIETVTLASASTEQHEAAATDVEASASQDSSVQTALVAERVRALDGAPHAANDKPDLTVEELMAVPALPKTDVSPAVSDPQPTAARASRFEAVARKPSVPQPAASVAPVRLPLAATTQIDRIAVNGSVSSANLRHGLERVQPSLSECYTRAAREAGENRFSKVRVLMTIDEAGRVKTQPTVEGAQLPGLEACIGSALSKLSCRAPDTGTAKASITVRFGPLVLADARHVQTQ